jgi:hypothetical protein
MSVGGRVIGEPLEQAPVVALRPHKHLYSQWFVAILALLVPIFAVLYWLTIPTGGWFGVLLTQLVLTVLLCVAVASFYLMRISVGGDGFTSRDGLGRLRVVPGSAVGSVMRLDLYRSGSLDLQPQLFVRGHDGSLLLRLTGHCWPIAALETMVEQIGAPVVRVAEPMTLLELSRAHPELLYWFERGFTAPDTAD